MLSYGNFIYKNSKEKTINKQAYDLYTNRLNIKIYKYKVHNEKISCFRKGTFDLCLSFPKQMISNNVKMKYYFPSFFFLLHFNLQHEILFFPMSDKWVILFNSKTTCNFRDFPFCSQFILSDISMS